MSRYDYTRYPYHLSMGLCAVLSHPKPSKISIVKDETCIPKDALQQIKADVAFAKSNSRQDAEAAVMTNIRSLEMLVSYIEALTDPTTRKVLNAYQDMIADPDIKADFIASTARELEFEDGKLLRIELFKRIDAR